MCLLLSLLLYPIIPKVWFGPAALEKGLCDSLRTPDEVLLSHVRNGFDVYSVSTVAQKTVLSDLAGGEAAFAKQAARFLLGRRGGGGGSGGGGGGLRGMFGQLVAGGGGQFLGRGGGVDGDGSPVPYDLTGYGAGNEGQYLLSSSTDGTGLVVGSGSDMGGCAGEGDGYDAGRW
jgi:hypothetical protein